MMSGDSTTSDYNFVDNNPYEVETTANLALTYDSTNAKFSRGCCTAAELNTGTCDAKNSNPNARETRNYREDGRKDY
jgi:hypothetical protein